MHILVTGAAGFIGSHLVDRLLADGHAVVGLDNFDPLYPRATKGKNLEAARKHPRFQLLEADIRDRIALEAYLICYTPPNGFDAIIHLAAKTGAHSSIQDPFGYQDTNITGTHNLLEFARRRHVSQFVFASSSSVYGINPNVPWSETDHLLQPISPYASTKASGEQLGHVYSHLYRIRFLSLRFSSVYGPRQPPDSAIHKFARLMLARQPIPFYGDGSSRRDYAFINDTVDGIVGALSYTATSCEMINLGSNRTVSLCELVGALEQTLGCSAVLDRQPGQPGDVPQTWTSVEKAARLLGYHPGTELAQGLASFAEWLSPGSVPRAVV